MLVYLSAAHAAHAPPQELYRGRAVSPFECPARVEGIRARLAADGHTFAPVPEFDLDAVRRVHDERYLRFLATIWERWIAQDPGRAGGDPQPVVWPVRSLRDDREPTNLNALCGLYSFDTGTPLTAGTWTAACGGAAASLAAADELLGRGRPSFVLTRPPGHHATADRYGGYCFLNNAAIAAQRLRDGGVARVAVLDVDYHHGNGTQSIYYERHDVLFVSVHGDPATEYPFLLGHADERGAGAGLGCNLNLPLPAGASAASWFEALAVGERRLLEYAPGALVVSLGFDAAADDPIATFRLTRDDFARLGERLRRLGLPTMLVLEGGYAVDSLPDYAAAVLGAYEAG